MSIVYLDGDYLPMAEARISPMDRGFLFGDGIYEVIPSYGGRMVGFKAHIERMQEGLKAIDINLDFSAQQWRTLCEQLIEHNGGGDLGIYLHVSRGADTKRSHAYPEGITPTLFAFSFDIPPAPVADKSATKCYSVTTAEDLRWKRCNIKSTALLGNVMHFNQSYRGGNNETILYNNAGELTEASACNVYIVKDGVVITPPTDHQILPGVTRLLLLNMLRADGEISVLERDVTLAELRNADEVWLSSSTKEVAPVTEVDGKAIGNGEPGDVWLRAQTLFSQHKYAY
ncbi:D-alanine aminotransferase [Halieaceae bacterium IMCC14734]|uniref:D-alanine aminotransferase n=1 Tax=Candidatus Litorirhabdus singularis TaxID=2518993 RepID=A0ABT3TFJ1_9GAMM|nr:D-amino acid aminotransferase [Candidatus Litorirhabdus singularis]MCX2981066.1 D-alanine aminotransferase [Candidatus Litorirhabdus singularis]